MNLFLRVDSQEEGKSVKVLRHKGLLTLKGTFPASILAMIEVILQICTENTA